MISREEIERIINKITPSPLKRLRFLSHGMNTTTFLASTRSDQFILSLFQDKEKLEDFPLLLRSHAILSQAGFPVPTILAHGNLFGQKFLLTNYHYGKVKNTYHKTDYEKIGFLLGNMHVALQSFDSPMERPFLIQQLRRTYEEVAPNLPKDFSIINKHLSYLESVWPTHLPSGLIHGDIWNKNILFDEGEISAILDFTSVTVDLLLFDLAGLFKVLYFSNDNREENFQALLSSYQMVRPFHEDELDHISTVIIAKMLHNILYMVKKTQDHPEQKPELYSIATMNLMKLEHSDLKEFKLVHSPIHA